MQVEVDYGRCDSTGVCTAIAPDVFELDEHDQLQVHAESVRPQLWQEIEEAARSCPKLAITLRDGD